MTTTPTPPSSASSPAPSTPAESAPPADAETDALQTALAAEHAAVYVYGVLGGQTSASRQPTLMRLVIDAFSTHQLRRDHLTALLAAAGETPVGTEPGYRVPPRLGTAAAVERTARGVEAACATAYAALVAATSAEVRSWSITALTDTAVRGLGFGAAPTPFPGTD
ncbi:ferritin-like domain-containing protein [Nocardioides insulae]|uniref:ferritin-like domain-containing protein n=1 Tax=Nocardioides insulae TaxID=394734 RepID=UPI0004222D44|nr:ferritin-like domain-containing protein [Nocardioides insulae]